MKLTNHKWFSAGGWMGLLSMAACLMSVFPGQVAGAQAISTTTVQGTVYLANGQPGTGTLVVSWPTFTTASGQLVTADSTTVPIAPDGFVSVNLAANVGASPAGLYYTAVYYMSDGSTNTQYWVVPAGAQAALGQVQAQLMPATQAVQAVNKAYVDQAIAGLTESLLTASGGTLSGPLTLCCDPTQPMQAADKHYVDEQSAMAVPLTGAAMTGPLTSVELGALYQVDQFPGTDFGAKLGACLSGLSHTNGGTCDARNFTGTLAMGSNLTISTANATVMLPCATISTSNQIIVTAGTRNVSLRGCALRGTSTASGSQGGTVFLYSGTTAMVQVGDPTYAVDTQGFHLDNIAINITSASSASAKGLAAYRTQEMDLESLYFLGNSNQTGMTLDGTGNYTGGTFSDDEFDGFQTAVNAIGHQISNPATTDWMNASTFLRLHIDCPTTGGNPISGSYGINLQQGDGNTFTGGDIEGCWTALHLGGNAQNNTIVGLRNENSTNQIVADAGSSYNSWMTGGTMFTGQLTDNGTRNSFLDTFHRSFNGLNGDWYGSQADATLTNHYRLGIGTGNERGLLNEIQTDYGYRWLEGYSDATAGEQFYQIDDLLNNVNRLSIGQYNNGQSSTNNQTAINSAGTGAVVLNGSANAGTGGVVIGSGGANESTVATISGAGNAQFNGSLQVGGASTLAGSTTVKNHGNAEIDYILQAGATASQKESLIYNDWNGNSQWYMVKNATNDWALNSATGGLDSFMAYQSTNSGDTYVNASNSTGVVRINYETGAGTGFKVYGGNSSTLYASFTGTTAIQFPGLAASSGHNCLQVDNSGYVTNTGAACATGSGSGTVNTGTSGQIAYYNGNGTTLSGTNTVPVTAGGTGASTASGALGNLGGAAITGAAFTGPVSAPTFMSTVATGTAPFTVTSTTPVPNLNIGGNAATATVAAGLSGAQALPNGTTATTQTAGDSTTKLATDAFVAAAASLSTIIPGATVSGTGSSQMLQFPGTVAAGTAITSLKINSYYFPEGSPSSCTVNSVTYTTQLDCLAATLGQNLATTGNVAIALGSGTYNTCSGITLAPASRSQSYVISILGVGSYGISGLPGGSTINQTCSSSIPTVYLPEESSSLSYPATSPSPRIEGVQINANHLAPNALGIYGHAIDGVIRDVFALNGTQSPIQLGSQPDLNNYGWLYEWKLEDVYVTDTAPHGGGAAISVSVSGGLPVFTVTTGGSGYTSNATITLLGTRGGISNTPCSSLGTSSLTITGGVVTGASSTATGCVAPMYAYVWDGYPISYAVDIQHMTDSTVDNLIVQQTVGQVAAVSLITGNVSFTNAHLESGSRYGFLDNLPGYNQDTFSGTNCGELFDSCFKMGTASQITDTRASNWLSNSPYFTFFSLSSTSLGIKIDSLICEQNAGLTREGNKILTPSGAINGPGIASGNNSYLHIDENSQCNNLAQPVTANSGPVNALPNGTALGTVSTPLNVSLVSPNAYTAVENTYVGDAPTGAHIQKDMGVDSANQYDYLQLDYYYAGPGSASNVASFGTGKNTSLHVFGDGDVSVNEGDCGSGGTVCIYGTLDTSGQINGATITASTEFNGPATGLTGTAAALNIGGNAATATLAAGLSGTPPLPNGTTATTQAALDNSTKVATTAYTDAAVGVETARAEGVETAKLAKANNLSDVASTATAKANLFGNTYGCLDGYDHLPCVVAQLILTGQTAGSTTALKASVPAGRYSAQCQNVLTQAATTSSTLPACQFNWTEATTGTSVYGGGSATSTANTVGTSVWATDYLDVSNSTTVNVNIYGTASSGTTPMQFKTIAVLRREY